MKDLVIPILMMIIWVPLVLEKMGSTTKGMPEEEGCMTEDPPFAEHAESALEEEINYDSVLHPSVDSSKAAWSFPDYASEYKEGLRLNVPYIVFDGNIVLIASEGEKKKLLSLYREEVRNLEGDTSIIFMVPSERLNRLEQEEQ